LWHFLPQHKLAYNNSLITNFISWGKLMRQFTLSERLRYRFDNIMSRGVIALIGWLFIVTLLMVVAVSLVVRITGSSPDDGEGFLNTAWTSFMHAIDAGTIAGDTPDNELFVFLMVIMTAGGIFIFSTLIGVLSAGLNERLEELRKGRSFVVEQNHTIILGWSVQIFSIIEQLVIANESQRRACIVILAEKDKVEMEDEIRARIPDLKTTRVVCRTGSPIDLTDLEIVNPNDARAVIILAQDTSDPDAHVIKSILALTNNPARKDANYHVVAEIRDPQNLEVARMISPNRVEVLPVSELISRITVQTCRQSGLSVVYIELLDFEGSEIYFKQPDPSLHQKSFGEALLSFEASCLIGLRSKDGKTQINPPMNTSIQPTDSLILIAEDDNKIQLSQRGTVQEGAIVKQAHQPRTPEKTLILGWNRRAPLMINELDSYVAPGSELTVLAEVENIAEIIAEECGSLRNQSVKVEIGSTTARRTLNDLDIPIYNHVIVLSYTDFLAPQDADARTLITLLHLRDLAEKAGKDFSIVSEMLDSRNRELAEGTRADDFIISDRLISLMLSQVSENRELMAVLTDIFDPEGSEIYLYPASDYVQTGTAVSLYTIFEAARQRGETMIGYRLVREATQKEHAYGVYVNPNKAKQVTFQPEDRIIVLSEG
jgi:ion channel POLLUX/CASTOR